MPNADDLLGALMAYEVYSAISKRCPLVTTLCRRYPVLTAGVLLVVFGHLRRPAAPRIAVRLYGATGR